MKNSATIVISVLLTLFSLLSCQSQEKKELKADFYNLRDKKYSEESFESIIEKYKGKVIYMDFWASWCRPCKNEMPYSLRLQKYFKGKDVVFVYFSSDRNPEAWERTIKAMQITGEHYLFNKKVYTERNRIAQVKYIPRYMLFDKNGNLVDDNAPRPSSSNIKTEIEKLLKN